MWRNFDAPDDKSSLFSNAQAEHKQDPYSIKLVDIDVDVNLDVAYVCMLDGSH
jgi:hypothetical protein